MNDLMPSPISCETLIVGAGAGGLGTAAMLKRRGRDSIIIERGRHPGEAWRERYDALRLNSVAQFSHLPGLMIDRGYGIYPSRDQFVEYLERYVEHFQLNIHLRTEATRIERCSNGWAIATNGNLYRATNLVIATGLDHTPWMPDWPGSDEFQGQLFHAAEFRNPQPFRGLDVLVVGCGNTGSELTHLLAAGGASRVRVSVRTPPNIMPRRWHGITLYPGSLLLDWLPEKAADVIGRWGQRLIVGDLSEFGLPFPDTGMKTNLRNGVPPTVVDGFVESVKSRAVEVVAAVSRFERQEVILADGSRISPEVVIAATGYRRNLNQLVSAFVAFDALGAPQVTRNYEADRTPRLYFVGYWAGLLGPLYYMRGQAKRVAGAIAQREKGRSVPSSWFRLGHSDTRLPQSLAASNGRGPDLRVDT